MDRKYYVFFDDAPDVLFGPFGRFDQALDFGNDSGRISTVKHTEYGDPSPKLKLPLGVLTEAAGEANVEHAQAVIEHLGLAEVFDDRAEIGHTVEKMIDWRSRR